jgi:hypothetical protein
VGIAGVLAEEVSEELGMARKLTRERRGREMIMLKEDKI